MTETELVNVGEISGVFGVKGWLKIHSFTDPRENILNYSPWVLKKNNELKEVTVTTGKQQGKTIVAYLETVTDRNIAESYIGWKILINRSQLPKSGKGDYYWNDLIGLQVETEQGITLGKVDSLIETGANDVLVIVDEEHERLIPFLLDDVVKTIDLTNNRMIVDWDPDF